MDGGIEFCSPPKRVVLGNLDQNGNSPISPMANLKLLTKVATSHFNVGENNEEEDTVEKRDLKGARRFRSLSFICKKFLLFYNLDIPAGTCEQISLGKLAVTLGIEKRRVYDIINVVASLNMAYKTGKDKYVWYGNQHLPQLLSKLKAYALINKFDEQINNLVQHQFFSAMLQESESPYIKITRGDRSGFEENRIRFLCQKFIMLFLVCDYEIPLNMCTISKLILPDDVQDKTGTRRLYDIANVLEALDLIKRYQCKIMKKPSFKYCGPKVNIDRADCERLVPGKWPCLGNAQETSDQGYITNSDSSSFDYIPNTSKLDSILEVVCTEFEETECCATSTPIANKKRCTGPTTVIQCSAKKQLFPSPFVLQSIDTETDTIDKNNGFIKAPKQSFRLEFNELQVKQPIFQEVNKHIEIKPTTNTNEPIMKSFKTSFNTFGHLQDNFPNKTGLLFDNNNSDNINNNNIQESQAGQVFIKEKSNDDSLRVTINKSENLKTIIINKQNPNTNSINQSLVPTKIKFHRPIKIAEIKNGGVYKVLKKGNSVQLYEL